MNHRIRIAILIVTGATVAVVAALIAGWMFKSGSMNPVSITPPGDDARTSSLIPRFSRGDVREFKRDSAALPDTSAAAIADPLLENLEASLNVPGAVQGEAVLSFKDKAAMASFVKNMRGAGLDLLGTLDKLNSIRVGYKDIHKLRDLIAGAGGDVSAEANQWMQVPREPQSDPNNEGGATPIGKAQEMMDAISAGGDRAGWGESVKIAVLDTGVLDHPTFGKDQITHLDFVKDGQTFHSHGTSVASLIAGQNAQAPGVAPAAHILDIRVANAEGYTVSTVLSQGIIEAVDRGAQVLNISLGGYGDSEVLRAALNYAANKGVIVVAAAGNDGYDQLSLPAAYGDVLSVGSVDKSKKQASFSNSGNGLDIVAPGVGVVSAWETDKVAIASGTSHSTGLVSGAVASYLGWGVSQKEVIALLKRHATPTGAATSRVGSGVLRVYKNAKK